MSKQYDAVIIGSGPNGLSAGIMLVKEGLKVLIVEGSDSPGGGMRTSEMTLSGFRHDICSAVHPMAYVSPYFKTLPLEKFGLEWIVPEASAAHPLDGEEAVILTKSIEETAAGLGIDEQKYLDLMSPLLSKADELIMESLKPLGLPKHPLLMLNFGLKAIQSATFFANRKFNGERAKALFAGCAAHSVLPLSNLFTAAIGLIFLTTGHVENWVVPKGGSMSITNALVRYFESLGGEMLFSTKIKNFKELPSAKKYVFDTDPIQLAKIAEDQLPALYKKRLNRYRFGPGVFKIDFALDGPIPWYDDNCLKASTVHVGGTLKEIAQSEKDAWNGRHNDKPFVMMAQQSQFDDSRAPYGKHTGWAYCHVPNGSQKDMTSQIENQIERFAPGFKDIVLDRKIMSTHDFYNYNTNYFGGAVTGGAADIFQLFSRPIAKLDPYKTANPDIFICSASSPPGGGVHGMCGFYAAKSVLESL